MIDFSKTISDFRTRVPAAQDWAYFETGSTGLVPDFVYEGVRRYIDDRYLKGGDSKWVYEKETVGTLCMHQRSKEAIAEMIHCKPSEIAFGLSSTHLFTMVTECIDYAEDDNIVTVQKGWIGSRFAWQKREAEGLKIRYIEPDNGMVTVERIIAVCDEHTRAVAVNLVESNTGYRMDMNALGKFCAEKEILLYVDGVQALGALEVNVKKWNIDFLVGNDYKWMMNFCGTGYAYISPKVQKLISHWGAGWMSDTDRFNTAKDRLQLRADAGRYEIGHQHNDGIYGLGLVATQNNRLGLSGIENYVCGLADYFCSRVEETEGIRLSYDFPKKNRCQIVPVKLENGLQVTEADFMDAKVCVHIGEYDENEEREMRIGFHYYNNREDIDRFFAVLRKGK